MHGGRKTQLLLYAFSPSSHWDNYSQKNFFFSKLQDKCWQNWRNPWGIVNIPFNDQNRNLSFRDFLLKYETPIKDNELHDKKQKIYTFFFYFYVLKEISPNVFSYIFKNKKNLLQLFIFTNVIRCSKLPLWMGYFIYLKFTRVSSIV